MPFVLAVDLAERRGLSTGRWAGWALVAVLAARGLALAPALAEVGSTSAAKAVARAEGAPVLLSRLAVREELDGLRVRPVRGVAFPRRFVVLLGAEGTLGSAAAALLRHLLRGRSSPAVLTDRDR